MLTFATLWCAQYVIGDDTGAQNSGAGRLLSIFFAVTASRIERLFIRQSTPASARRSIKERVDAPNSGQK